MKKKTKATTRLLSLLLMIAMVLTTPGIPALAETVTRASTPANPVHHCTKKDDGTDTTDWSYVYFGSYPQTEVKGTSLTTEIRRASFDANGDAWVNGTKYRRISKSDTNHSEYFGDSTYRYFKWEPIKWRVLQNNGSTLFVVADKGIDCKDYHDTCTSITWENCTLRNWLNSSFYGTAFSSSEQGAIVEQTVVNEDNPYWGREGGNSTRDKVYLLSIGELTDPNYGFCEKYQTQSASRRLKTSDYAHARGAWKNTGIYYTDNCWWWLRSPGYSTRDAAGVFDYGYVDRNGYDVDIYYNAVVPALHIDLSSGLWSTVDDGSSGEGGSGGTGGGDYPGTVTTTTTTSLAKDEIGLYVYRKDTQRGVSDFHIYIDSLSNEVTTDSNGTAKVKLSEGKHTFYFTNNDGYVTSSQTVTNCRHRQLYSFGVVPISDNPVLLNAECTVDGNTYNVLNSKLELEKDDTFNLELVGSTPETMYISSYELWQGQSKKKTSTSGVFTNLSAGDFDENREIYVCMNLSNGAVAKFWLKLTVEAGRILDASNSIKLGEEVKLKLDSSYPVIGGMELKLNLGRLPIYSEYSGGKFKIALNVKKERKSNGKWEGDCLTDDVWEGFKECVEKNYNIDNYWEKTAKNWLSTEQTPYQKLGKQKLNIEIAGYMEGSKDSLNGKISIKLTAQPEDTETQYLIGTVPMVFILGVKGSIDGSMEVKIREFDFSQPQITGGLTPEATISVGVGPGLTKAAYVTANGSGTLKDEMRYNYENRFLWQEVSLLFRFFAKMKFFFLETELPFAEKKVILYSDRTDAYNMEQLDLAEAPADMDINNVESYAIQERIVESSGLLSESAEADTGDSDKNLLQENAFSYTDMKIIETEDTTMVVYMADNKERAVGDGSMLMYAILDKETGTFKSPKAIEDDGTGDFTPSMASDGKNIYVVWSEFQNKVGEGEEIDTEQIASGSEIKLGIYNKENDAFEIVQVTENEQMDVYPSILMRGEEAVIAWAANTNNNILLNDAASKIKYTVFADGKLSEEKTVAEDISSLETVVLANVHGKECVAYTNDKDADMTTEGNYLNVCALDGTKLLTLEGIFRDLQYQAGLEKPILTWNADGAIKYLKEDLSTEYYLPAENRVDGKYRIYEKDGVKTLYFIKNMELNANNVVTSELACYTDNGTGEWSKAAMLSDENQRLSDFVIYSAEDGEKYAYNQLILDEDATVQAAEVYENEVLETVDVAIAEFVYRENITGDATGETEVDFVLQNTGNVPVDSLTLCIKDGDTVLGQTAWNGSLLQGESTDVSATVALKEYPKEDTELTFEVVAEGDVHTDNNRKNIILGQADLDISIEESWEEEGVLYSITGQNNSLQTVSDAKLCIYEQGDKENPIETLDLEAMDSSNSSNTIYYLPYEKLEFAEDTKIIYFELESSAVEAATANNTAFSVIENPELVGEEPEDVLLEGITLSQEVLELEVGDTQNLYADLNPYNATNIGEVKWSSSDTAVVSVDETGELTALKEGTSTITVLVNDFQKECLVTVTAKEASVTEEKVIYKDDGITEDNPDPDNPEQPNDNPSDNENTDENDTSNSEATARDKAAAKAVSDYIAAIGTVTLNSENAIKTARTAYDALTPAQKAYVANYSILTEAEAVLAKLKENSQSQNAGSNEKPEENQEQEQTVQVGSTFKAGNFQYKITKISGKNSTVTLLKGSKKSLKKLTIPGTVKYKGTKYKVTAIGNNAFKKYNKLKTVVIGKNVTIIGKSAFQGCKNIKTITIKSKKIKKVGNKAFYGIKSSAKIKVGSAKMLKKYKKVFHKKALGKVKLVK
ncbi:MAG: Ig-like domain-containing protein [Lachnospiraceae bacterium]|nr:Ig-like domain-containing protein [Lachnospiraceae bacterium]